MRGNCIDVSEHNGEIDWNRAKADGVEYAFIRAGFGQDNENQDDKYFHINMENALEAGVKVGVFFYAYASDYDTAVGEAVHCIRLIEPYRDRIAFPVFYDLEEEKNIAHIKDVVDGFRNKMEYHGYNVGCYTTTSWYDAFFRDIECNYIWLAWLGSEKPCYCDVWQYSWTENVDGVGPCDADILYNTDMKLLFNEPEPEPAPKPEPQPTPEPEPTPEPVTEKVIIELDVLKQGDKGGQVNTVKALLNGYGFLDWNENELELDGDFDDLTEYVVKCYQDAHGIQITGTVTAETWRLLLL